MTEDDAVDLQAKVPVSLFYQNDEWFIAAKGQGKFLLSVTCEQRNAWRRVMDLHEDYEAWVTGHETYWDDEDMSPELFPQLWKQFQSEVEHIWTGAYEVGNKHGKIAGEYWHSPYIGNPEESAWPYAF